VFQTKKEIKNDVFLFCAPPFHDKMQLECDEWVKDDWEIMYLQSVNIENLAKGTGLELSMYLIS